MEATFTLPGLCPLLTRLLFSDSAAITTLGGQRVTLRFQEDEKEDFGKTLPSCLAMRVLLPKTCPAGERSSEQEMRQVGECRRRIGARKLKQKKLCVRRAPQNQYIASRSFKRKLGRETRTLACNLEKRQTKAAEITGTSRSSSRSCNSSN